MLNITFVAMMYGLGMPILFPVAVGTLLVLYCTEKAMVYYSCSLPPMYDEKLNNSVLSLMTYAPLFLLGFGYWMLSNKQLLQNDIIFNDENTVGPRSGHVWTSVFSAEGYETPAAMPLIVCFWIFLVAIVFRN